MPVAGSEELVDSKSALPDEPAIAKAAAAGRHRATAEAAQPLKIARKAYLDRRASEVLSAKDHECPEKLDAARAVIRGAVESSALTETFPIEVEVEPGTFETVTVGRILNDRAGFHGRATRDPSEPNYGCGRAVGKLFLLDSRPALFSFARGGRSFRLFRAPERIGVAAGRLADATGVFDPAAMAAAITVPMLRDRILGRSENLSIPNRALLLLTGNNPAPAGDPAAPNHHDPHRPRDGCAIRASV